MLLRFIIYCLSRTVNFLIYIYEYFQNMWKVCKSADFWLSFSWILTQLVWEGCQEAIFNNSSKSFWWAWSMGHSLNAMVYRNGERDSKAVCWGQRLRNWVTWADILLLIPLNMLLKHCFLTSTREGKAKGLLWGFSP